MRLFLLFIFHNNSQETVTEGIVLLFNPAFLSSKIPQFLKEFKFKTILQYHLSLCDSQVRPPSPSLHRLRIPNFLHHEPNNITNS